MPSPLGTALTFELGGLANHRRRARSKRLGHDSRVRCREGYEDWNENDVCLLLEELAFGTVGHLFGTIYNAEKKNLASAMAKSRLMRMIPFRW